MRVIRYIPTFLIFLAFPAAAQAATPYAQTIGEFMGLPVTNSMVTSWVISLAIILAVRIAVGTPKLKPARGQLIVESVILGIQDLIAPIVGKHMVRPTIWLLSGLFIYIMIHNWSGLLPGVGTIGYGYEQNGTVVITDPWIRPANADWNMTLALAAVSMVCWFYYVMKYAGPGAFIHELFGNKAEKSEIATPIYIVLTFVFLFVGLVEIVSIVLRPVTLSFRLFGNVFGGENLIHSMYGIFHYIVPIPFYFLELLVGVVQALVFTLLVAVYIGLVCNHEGGEHH